MQLNQTLLVKIIVSRVSALLLRKDYYTISKQVLIPILLFVFGCGQSPQPIEKNQTIWYDSPAQEWNEALPIGNGRIGAMIFGDPIHERIQLNDDSIWPGEMNWDLPSGNSEDLKKIRTLLFQGKNTQADKLFVEKFSNQTIVRSHQTLGDLYVDFDHKDITDYKRTLDISKAIFTTSFKSDGYLVKQEAFASHPDNCMVIKYTSNHPDGLSGQLRLSRPKDDGHPTAAVTTPNQNTIVMIGQASQREGIFRSETTPITTGVEFETQAYIKNKGGVLSNEEDIVSFTNASEMVLYIVNSTSYYAVDQHKQSEKYLADIKNAGYEYLKDRHINDYQKLYNRVSLSLTDQSMEHLTTIERLDSIKAGHVDLGLEALLFQYGRYLLISCSRPETNPANLQGLWNEHIKAPWNADYHMNINLQMNYWPANVTNLEELNQPLFDFTDRLFENGRTVARENFGCRGTFTPHASDLWAPAWLRAPRTYWGCSVGGAGWMAQHYMHHFEFTQDTSFLLDRAMPAIRQVAQFYSDWIIEDPRDGTLISAPSTSPENQYIDASGQKVASCLGSAMDQQIIAEVFDHYIRCCEVLQRQDDLLREVQKQLPKLRPGFVIGSDGRILEWDRPYDEPEPGHRHMSHLYGFHPGTAVSSDDHPEIYQAVRTTLQHRLANGGAGTGWSRAWLINCSARLKDGEMAHDHIKELFKKSMYDNLFDAHPPFQIDGNFGYTAGVAEMLIQSHENKLIRLLPALPTSWSTGQVTGLKARGAHEVDIHWKNNTLWKAIITSKNDDVITLAYDGRKYKVKVKKDKPFVFEPFKN